MALFGDRIKVACSTTGSTATTLTLGSAVSGFQTLSEGGLSNGDSVRYVIEDGSNFEIGLGTYATGSPDTLTGRSDANVSASSNSNNRINLSGSSTLFIAPTAADLQTVHVYSATSDLPSASDNHGMIAHVHGLGRMVFAHGGSWINLANASEITSYTHPNHSGEVTSTGDGATVIADNVVDEANLKVSNSPTDGYVLTARSGNTGGLTWEAASGGGGIALTDLSVTQNSASGSGSLTYNNTSGVFSYTPPASSGGSGSTLSDPIRQTEYTGTATSTFNASSSPALPAYTAGNIQVFLNGSKLSDDDFQASNGTSVVLDSPCAATDVVTIVEYGAPFASQYSSTIFTVGTSSEYNTSTKVLTTDYTATKVAVYLNGVKLLVGTDCTATNGTTIDLTNAAPVTGDKIEVVEHGALAESGSGSGVTTYTDKTAIDAVSSPSEGDLAYDLAADQLYIRTTSAWKRIALGVDETPVVTTEPESTHSLNGDGSTSTVTMLAYDPEGFGITYGIAYSNATNALPNQLSSATSINQTTGVFTFTPSTNTSHEGNTTVRLSASDGISSTTRLVTLALLFPLNGGDRGLHFHGGGVNYIDYFSIATAANAADFGDKTDTTGLSAACSNGTRAVRGGGGWVNTIDYVTVATLGNAASFGILIGASLGTHASVSNGTLGFFAGGAAGGASYIQDSIQYITIATTGNATDGGDLSVARWRIAGAANTTHALFAGGRTSSADSNVIDKFTMGTSANATDFGDFVGTGQWSSGSADTTRAIWKNGNSSSVTDALQYSTIDTAGNSTDFGDVTAARARTASCSDLTYAVISGGDNSGNTMDYVTIQTTGNATDFGDLQAASSGGSSTSGASS